MKSQQQDNNNKNDILAYITLADASSSDCGGNNAAATTTTPTTAAIKSSANQQYNIQSQLRQSRRGYSLFNAVGLQTLKLNAVDAMLIVISVCHADPIPTTIQTLFELGSFTYPLGLKAVVVLVGVE